MQNIVMFPPDAFIDICVPFVDAIFELNLSACFPASSKTHPFFIGEGQASAFKLDALSGLGFIINIKQVAILSHLKGGESLKNVLYF